MVLFSSHRMRKRRTSVRPISSRGSRDRPGRPGSPSRSRPPRTARGPRRGSWRGWHLLVGSGGRRRGHLRERVRRHHGARARAANVDGWHLSGYIAAEQPLVPDQERPTSPWFFVAPSLPTARSVRSRPSAGPSPSRACGSTRRGATQRGGHDPHPRTRSTGHAGCDRAAASSPVAARIQRAAVERGDRALITARGRVPVAAAAP